MKTILVKELHRIHTSMVRILGIRINHPNERHKTVPVHTSPGIGAIEVSRQQHNRQRSTIDTLPRFTTSTLGDLLDLLRNFLRSLLHGLGGLCSCGIGGISYSAGPR
jgi:hypothetical protein